MKFKTRALGAGMTPAGRMCVPGLPPMSICPEGSDPASTPFIGVFVLFLAAFQIVPIGHLRAQAPGTAGHEHLTEVACVDVPPGGKRPEFGCFNVGTVTGLHFSQSSVYWHLRAFPSRKAAETARSATGIVVEEDGRVWLSEFGPRNAAPRGGDAIAIVGPLQLPRQRATLRCSPTLSCGPATIRECTRTRAPRGGTCWRESNAWRRRLAPLGLGPEATWRCRRIFQWN